MEMEYGGVMNICRLFIIAVFCLFTGIVNGMQTVFDLPDNTPGLIGPHDVKFKIGWDDPISKTLIRVIVPDTPADVAENDSMAQNVHGNIYFPSDGRQPTTEESVEWACANIYNTEDSPITQWYMKMFGVIPFRNEEDPGPDDFIKAGYDENNNKKRIISYDFETMGTDEGYEVSYHVHHDTQQEETRRKSFIDNFMKIASTSVGRVLLYRILIEIRRKDERGNGCEENNSSNLKVRNAARFLNVYLGNGNSFMYPTFEKQRTIPLRNLLNQTYKEILKLKEPAKLNFSDSDKKTAIVFKNSEDSHFIDLKPRSVDIALFHELCHWYHFLRNTDRFTQENSCASNYPKMLSKNEIGKILYGGLDGENNDNRNEISAKSWTRSVSTINTAGHECSLNSIKQIVTYEELRNIIGLSKETDGYIRGDDLCENLYRLCINSPMRFSHSDEQYIEDSNVINKAKEISEKNIKIFQVNNMFQFADLEDHICLMDFNTKGLGKCARKSESKDEKNYKSTHRGSFETIEEE